MKRIIFIFLLSPLFLNGQTFESNVRSTTYNKVGKTTITQDKKTSFQVGQDSICIQTDFADWCEKINMVDVKGTKSKTYYLATGHSDYIVHYDIKNKITMIEEFPAVGPMMRTYYRK